MISNKSYHAPLLLGICIIMFFTHLADVSPPTIMEARNFIYAREMLESGNWMIPTLNGSVRIRKPPLPTWFTTAAIYIAGKPNSLMALRFPAAMIATVMIFFMYGLVKDLFKNSYTAFYAAAVLASCFMFVEEARTGAWDVYCNAFMLGAIWMLYRASQKNNLKHWALSGLFMGLSFMSKGPVSFYALLLPFLIAFFLSRNKFTRSSMSGAGLCILITILVSTFWPIYLYLKIPDIASQIANEESSAWINRHNRPLWFYLHFPLFTGIWTLAVLFAFYNFRKLQSAFASKNIKLVLFWFLTTFLLLSIIPEKKERYFLPALPPLAILIGTMVSYHMEQYRKGNVDNKTGIFIRIQGALMILASLGIVIIAWQFGLNADEITVGFFVFIIIIAIGIIASAGLSLYRKKELIYPLSIVVMLFFCIAIWPLISKIKQDNPQYRDLREVREIKTIRSKPLYATVTLNPIRIWEIGRKVNTSAEEPPKNNAVIISSTKLGNAKEVLTFHPNPDHEEEVIYFNVME